MAASVRRLPEFDELPVRAGAPPGSSWGLWGEGDANGCLNLLTPERVRAGLAAAVDGQVFNLNLELDLPDPPFFGRKRLRHTVLDSTTGHDDVIDDYNTQSSSQWDGFRHVAHPKYGFYNGVADGDHGIHHWAQRGIVGRGVLCDVARWRAAQGRPIVPDEPHPIEPSDLTAALAAQGTVVEPGDILLIRTGWLGWYRALDRAQREAYAAQRVPPSCGLRPGTETARVLWNLHIAAAAADNPGFEVMPPGSFVAPDDFPALRADPERAEEWFVHTSLLAKLGLPLGEFFDLEALAGACATDGRYTFLVTSAPLNLPAGVGTPPNALAIR